MIHSNRLANSALAALLLYLASGQTPAWCQAPPQSSGWAKLQQLPSGKQARVVLKDARSYLGHFQAATDAAVIVQLATGQDTTFERDTILRVSVMRPSHRVRNTLLGGLAGLVGGAVADALKCRGQNPSCHEGSVLIVTPLMGTGLLIGAAAPTGGWQEIYRAP